jgi:hypothetical protein
MKSQTKCPKCGTSIDVEQVLYDQLAKKAELSAKEEAEKSWQQQKRQLEKKMREETDQGFVALREELAKKSEQVKNMHRLSAKVEQLQRENEEQREKIQADAEAKLNRILVQERARITKSAEDKSELKLKEKEQLVEQLQQSLKEAQRRISQGSMQLQGEVQEIVIEEYLRTTFPLDHVTEVKKGARGADCSLQVNTRLKQNCGIIYVESKRTKEFSHIWIEKFKNDMRQVNAVTGVLITEAMPKGADRLCQIDGVWVCTLEEFKGLVQVLRESLVLLDSAIASQVNKADKMTVLYDYLTGREFRSHIESIVEGFMQMRSDLDMERRAMEAIWKKREKQISKVTTNTAHMYGSLRAIAGIAGVNGLELPA